MARRMTDLSIQELQAEIEKRQQQLPRLQRQRKQLAKRMADLDKQIAALSGRPRRKSSRSKAGTAQRRRTGKALPECIRDVLARSRKPMRVKDVEAAVRKAGYRTQSKDFYGAVATALREGKDFQKVNRGVYKLKGKPAAGRAGKKATASSRPRQRARNKNSLKDALVQVMRGKKRMTVAEATQAVQSAGYKSTSNSFRGLVSQTLNREDAFASAGRGVYRLNAG